MSKVRTSGDVTAIYEELTNRLADPNWKCRLVLCLLFRHYLFSPLIF